MLEQKLYRVELPNFDKIGSRADIFQLVPYILVYWHDCVAPVADVFLSMYVIYTI